MAKRRVSVLVLPAALASVGGFCETAAAFEPSVNYMLQCMGCHTPDGSGAPGRVPSIRATLLPFSAVATGRRFLVQVPGAAQSTLSDAELAKLLNWMIRNLSATKSERFIRFSESEVATYRRTPLVEVKSTREALLKETSGGGSHP